MADKKKTTTSKTTNTAKKKNNKKVNGRAKLQRAYWEQERQLRTLIIWAQNGVTYNEMAEKIGITRQTFNNWRNASALIADAAESGYDVQEYRLQQKGISLIDEMDGDDEQITTYEAINKDTGEWEERSRVRRDQSLQRKKIQFDATNKLLEGVRKKTAKNEITINTENENTQNGLIASLDADSLNKLISMTQAALSSQNGGE